MYFGSATLASVVNASGGPILNVASFATFCVGILTFIGSAGAQQIFFPCVPRGQLNLCRHPCGKKAPRHPKT